MISENPTGRYQIKLLDVREARNVKQLWMLRVPDDGRAGTILGLRGVIATVLDYHDPDWIAATCADKPPAESTDWLITPGAQRSGQPRDPTDASFESPSEGRQDMA